MGDDREGAQSGGAHARRDDTIGEDFLRRSSAPAPVDGSGLASEYGQEVDESNREISATSTSIPDDDASLQQQQQQQQLGSSPSTTTNGLLDGAVEATDMEALRSENALLRLALKEAEEKLRLVNISSNGGGSPRSIRPTRREPGNHGVAYARMRRLLLKDDGFLHDTFLPFLNMDDLAR